MIVSRTDLAVLKPFRAGAAEPWRFSVWHGVALLLALIVAMMPCVPGAACTSPMPTATISAAISATPCHTQK